MSKNSQKRPRPSGEPKSSLPPRNKLEIQLNESITIPLAKARYLQDRFQDQTRARYKQVSSNCYYASLVAKESWRDIDSLRFLLKAQANTKQKTQRDLEVKLELLLKAKAKIHDVAERLLACSETNLLTPGEFEEDGGLLLEIDSYLDKFEEHLTSRVVMENKARWNEGNPTLIESKA